jgi:colanic acid/amylovoran biosynthesis glycosyltransferase
MRVAFAHYSEPNDIGGVTTWVMAIARRLQADGIEVGIHLLHNKANDPNTSSLFSELCDANIHLSWASAHPNLMRDARQTLAFLNSWQPTLFLPQCKPAHYVAAAIAGLQGLPWVLTIHSDDPDYWAVARSLPPTHYGGRTVGVSEHISRRVVDDGFDPHPWVIPYGVVVPLASTRFHSQPFRVVYSGRLWEHQKRASLVIDTLISACGKDASIVATVIGDGYARQACEDKVAAAGLAHAITFTGRLPPTDVQTILCNCQAILLMSDFEGLPVALLEAMAAGVVPVVREIPSGIPELIHQEQTGLLVSDDPEAAAAALIRLAGDPSLWRHCSNAARQLVVERYSESKSYASWLQLIQDLDQRSSPIYPIQFRNQIHLRHLDPLLHAPYQSTTGFQASAKRLLSTYQAKAKYAAKRLFYNP